MSSWQMTHNHRHIDNFPHNTWFRHIGFRSWECSRSYWTVQGPLIPKKGSFFFYYCCHGNNSRGYYNVTQRQNLHCWESSSLSLESWQSFSHLLMFISSKLTLPIFPQLCSQRSPLEQEILQMWSKSSHPSSQNVFGGQSLVDNRLCPPRLASTVKKRARTRRVKRVLIMMLRSRDCWLQFAWNALAHR